MRPAFRGGCLFCARSFGQFSAKTRATANRNDLGNLTARSAPSSAPPRKNPQEHTRIAMELMLPGHFTSFEAAINCQLRQAGKRDNRLRREKVMVHSGSQTR